MLDASQMELLRDTLEIYEAAQLGDLNRTADSLRLVVKQLGGPASGYLPWARKVVRGAWTSIPDRRPVIAMLATAMLLMLANMSIEPIITVYVAEFVPAPEVVFTAGLVMAASAVGGVIAAPRLGRLADRIGPWNVIVGCLLVCGVLLIPQAFVTSRWQLLGLRFLMGMSLAGLMPAVAATIRHSVPDGGVGTILGYSTSAQYAGQVIGPVVGGFVGGHFGMRAVCLATTVIMFGGAVYNWAISRQVAHRRW